MKCTLLLVFALILLHGCDYAKEKKLDNTTYYAILEYDSGIPAQVPPLRVDSTMHASNVWKFTDGLFYCGNLSLLHFNAYSIDDDDLLLIGRRDTLRLSIGSVDEILMIHSTYPRREHSWVLIRDDAWTHISWKINECRSNIEPHYEKLDVPY